MRAQMSGDLPATVDAIRLADDRTRLQGELPLSRMTRLRTACPDQCGQARVDLYFERGGERGLRRIHGTVAATVRVTCQRCLQPLTLDLRAQPSLIVVKSEERPDLAEDDSEVLVADAPISLSDIVEDELLLAMPMIPKHEARECSGAPGHAAGHSRQASPFAVLSRLRREQD